MKLQVIGLSVLILSNGAVLHAMEPKGKGREQPGPFLPRLNATFIDEHGQVVSPDDVRYPEIESPRSLQPQHLRPLYPLVSAFNQAIEEDLERESLRSIRGPLPGSFDYAMTHASNSTIRQTPFHITPDSFGQEGKQILLLGVKAYHNASQCAEIKTGLAAIYNKISGDRSGVETLINDARALEYANKSYTFLIKETTYPDLDKTFSQISAGNYPEARDLAVATQRLMLQVLLYPHVVKTSDMRMPRKNIGMMFMGADVEIKAQILKHNKDIDLEANTSPARGTALVCAYCMQQFLDK